MANPLQWAELWIFPQEKHYHHLNINQWYIGNVHVFGPLGPVQRAVERQKPVPGYNVTLYPGTGWLPLTALCTGTQCESA